MRRRSRRRQEQLNRELFGPGPKVRRVRKRREYAPVPHPEYAPGNCRACGNVAYVDPDAEPWTCDSCGVRYLPIPHEAARAYLTHDVELPPSEAVYPEEQDDARE